jgi:hypothetical protein
MRSTRTKPGRSPCRLIASNASRLPEQSEGSFDLLKMIRNQHLEAPKVFEIDPSGLRCRLVMLFFVAQDLKAAVKQQTC